MSRDSRLDLIGQCRRCGGNLTSNHRCPAFDKASFDQPDLPIPDDCYMECSKKSGVCDHNCKTECWWKASDEPPSATPAEEIEDAAYQLAMLGLQSNRYSLDREFSDAVDDVLNMIQQKVMSR